MRSDVLCFFLYSRGTFFFTVSLQQFFMSEFFFLIHEFHAGAIREPVKPVTVLNSANIFPLGTVDA